MLYAPLHQLFCRYIRYVFSCEPLGSRSRDIWGPNCWNSYPKQIGRKEGEGKRDKTQVTVSVSLRKEDED